MLLSFILFVFIIAANGFILVTKLKEASYLKIDCSDIKSKEDFLGEKYTAFCNKLSFNLMRIYLPLIALNIILFISIHALNYIFYGSTISIDENSLGSEYTKTLSNLILITIVICVILFFINFRYMNVQIKKTYYNKVGYVIGLWHDFKVIFIYWFIFCTDIIFIIGYIFYHM